MGYVLCFFGGGLIGIIGMCLMIAVRESEREQEKFKREFDATYQDIDHAIKRLQEMGRGWTNAD